MNEFTNLDASRFFNFTCQRHDAMTRSATNNLLVPEKCRLDVRKYFFSNRVVHHWNSLPLEIREVDSVNAFKNMYDEWMCFDQDNESIYSV